MPASWNQILEVISANYCLRNQWLERIGLVRDFQDVLSIPMNAGVQCEHNWTFEAPIHHHLSDPSDKKHSKKHLSKEVTLESGVSKGDLTKIPLMQVL